MSLSWEPERPPLPQLANPATATGRSPAVCWSGASLPRPRSATCWPQA